MTGVRRYVCDDGRARLRLAGVPPTATLGDLALFGEGGHDAIQVVLLDPHRLGELGDRDAGARFDELQRLHGAGAAATRAAAPAGARGAAAAAPPGRGSG